MDIHSFAAIHAKATLSPFQYVAQSLGDYDIEVEISHCGICHSDVHLIDNDWGMSQYPLVPGHEIIGVIKNKGSKVDHLQLNQRVGIGWQRSSCMQCEWCQKGQENFCPHQQATCVGHHGGFADRMIADSRFAFAIPEKLESMSTAPLLCGGITVYSPLKKFVTYSSMRIGIIGIGGLGHIALQFAAAMKTEVFAFSSTPSKEQEAKSFGAHEFISNQTQMKKLISSFDVIISTATANLAWGDYLALLKPQGQFCFVGVSAAEVSIPLFALIAGQKSVCGSPIGNRADIQEMLQFAEKHQIKAQTEVLPLNQVNQAIEKVRHNQARYRMVLANY